MRVFTLLLLLLNIGYLLWQMVFRDEEEPVALVRDASRGTPETLRLLSELEGPLEAASSRSVPCFRVGVFTDTAESDRLISELAAQGYAASALLTQVDQPPDYWVHMPPFVSEAAALRRLEELQSKNIDSYLITGGELAGGISLGLFSRRELALRIQGELAAQGYPANIREVPRTYTEIWVEVREGGGDVPASARLPAFLDQRPRLQVVENICETIAPEP